MTLKKENSQLKATLNRYQLTINRLCNKFNIDLNTLNINTDEQDENEEAWLFYVPENKTLDDILKALDIEKSSSQIIIKVDKITSNKVSMFD